MSSTYQRLKKNSIRVLIEHASVLSKRRTANVCLRRIINEFGNKLYFLITFLIFIKLASFLAVRKRMKNLRAFKSAHCCVNNKLRNAR